MTRRNRDEHTIRQLFKTGGGSYGMTLPITFIRDLGWRERQKVVVRKSGKRLIIEDWKE